MSRSAQDDDNDEDEEVDVLLDDGTVMAKLRLLRVQTWSTEILGTSPNLGVQGRRLDIRCYPELTATPTWGVKKSLV